MPCHPAIDVGSHVFLLLCLHESNLLGASSGPTRRHQQASRVRGGAPLTPNFIPSCPPAPTAGVMPGLPRRLERPRWRDAWTVNRWNNNKASLRVFPLDCTLASRPPTSPSFRRPYTGAHRAHRPLPTPPAPLAFQAARRASAPRRLRTPRPSGGNRAATPSVPH
jgi:hypothetical protein